MSWCQIRDWDVVCLNVVNLVVAVESKEQVDQSFSCAVILQLEHQAKHGSQSVDLSGELKRLGSISGDGIHAGGHGFDVRSSREELEAIHVLLEGAIHACIRRQRTWEKVNTF